MLPERTREISPKACFLGNSRTLVGMVLAVRHEEVFLPFPAPTKEQVPVATRFRSTWLTSSLRAIKDRGRLDEYLVHLPREHHDVILNSVAAVWLPAGVALAHYDAADLLHFSPLELVAIGREVHTYAQASVFSMLVKLATGAGVTPWTALAQFRRLWERVWVGGGVGVFKTGPKEARLELVAWPCSRSMYVHHAMRGVVAGMLEVFCTKAYLTELPRYCTPTSLGYRCAWA
jgi:hypothetical protein